MSEYIERFRSVVTASFSAPAIERCRWICISVLIVVGIGAGCSVERTIDAERLEAEISNQLLPNYPGAVRTVSCPNAPDPEPGQEFLCLVSLDEGQVLDVNVTIGGTPEELTTTASIDARFVAVNEVAALLAATFGDEIGLNTSVDCGSPIVVLQTDEAVLCRATDPSGVTRDFDVLIDDAGVVDLQLR